MSAAGEGPIAWAAYIQADEREWMLISLHTTQEGAEAAVEAEHAIEEDPKPHWRDVTQVEWDNDGDGNWPNAYGPVTRVWVCGDDRLDEARYGCVKAMELLP